MFSLLLVLNILLFFSQAHYIYPNPGAKPETTHGLSQIIFFIILMRMNQGFGSVTFQLADLDLLDPNPPENALKLKEGNFSTTLLIIGFRIHRKNYIKTERRTRNIILII